MRIWLDLIDQQLFGGKIVVVGDRRLQVRYFFRTQIQRGRRSRCAAPVASLELWANAEETQALQRRRASETAATALTLDKAMSSSLKHASFDFRFSDEYLVGRWSRFVLWMTRAGIALPCERTISRSGIGDPTAH